MKARLYAFAALGALALIFCIGANAAVAMYTYEDCFTGEVLCGDRAAAGGFTVTASAVVGGHELLEASYSPATGEGAAHSRWLWAEPEPERIEMRPGIEVRAKMRRADYSWTGAEPDRESFEPWAWELYSALGGGNFSGRVALNDYLDSWPVYVSGGANMMSDGPGAYTLAPFAGEVLADVEIERSAEGGSMKVRPALRTACYGGGCIAHAAGKAYFLLYVVGEEPAYGETLRLYRADCSEFGERNPRLYIVDLATVEQVYEADMEYNSAELAVSADGGEVYIFTSGEGVQLTVVDTEDFTTRQRVTLLDGAEPALDFSYQWDRVDLLPGCIAVRVGGYTLAAAEIDGRYEPVCAVKDLSLPDDGAGSAGFNRRTHVWDGRRFALLDYGVKWYLAEDGTFSYFRLSVFENGELSYCEWIYLPFGGELDPKCALRADTVEEEPA